MRRSWVLAVALASASNAVVVPAASAVGPPTRPALDTDLLQHALEQSLHGPGAAPGVSAAVVLPGGRTWTGVAGFADAGKQRRVNPSTPFAVASVTKTVVVAVALRLAERGALDLDAPVARWYPELARSDRVTMRQLLGHTSGLDALPRRSAARTGRRLDSGRAVGPSASRLRARDLLRL